MQAYTRKDLELFNLLQHPVWIMDASRKEIFWANRIAVRLWNASTLEELLNRDFKTDMSEAAEARINASLKRTVNGEVIQEQWTLYPLGKATTVHITGSAIKIRNIDDLEGRYAILVECRERLDEGKQEQDTLTRSVEMLRHLSLPVCQFDMEGRLQYQNPKAERLFNSTEHGSWNDFHTRFVDKELAKCILQKVQNGYDYNVEAEHYTSNGPRWFFVTVKRARDPVSSENVVLYSAQDITEVVEARKERITVNEKSEFFAVVAHELRTPLHQIIGYLDLFESDGLREKQIESLRIIQSSSTLLMSIINDLLDYTKLENGKLKLENIAFRTRDVVQSSLAAVVAGATAKKLTIMNNIDTKASTGVPEMLMGDPNRLRQILLNFLSNAIKFTNQGSVSINVFVVPDATTIDHYLPEQCTKKSEMIRSGMLCQSLNETTIPCNLKMDKQRSVVVRFEVSDTGIGIDPKHQAMLFRKYQQGNSSISRNYGGTGLGLAICKSLADLMDAKIGLTSQVGVGTTTFLEVPFARCTSACSYPKDEPIPRPVPQLSSEHKVLHILVVEDNAINQKMVFAMLTKLGFVVSVAENGQVAVDMVRTRCYDIVLMDVQMPIMDGIEATKRIRGMKGRESDALTIIGLTAAYETSDLDYYKGIGMNTCIGKPVRLDSLKKSINAAVSLKLQEPKQ